MSRDSFEIVSLEAHNGRAERVQGTWDDLFARAEKVYHGLEKAKRIAFFEVVYAPVALITHANRMYIAGKLVCLHRYRSSS